MHSRDNQALSTIKATFKEYTHYFMDERDYKSTHALRDNQALSMACNVPVKLLKEVKCSQANAPTHFC